MTEQIKNLGRAATSILLAALMVFLLFPAAAIAGVPGQIGPYRVELRTDPAVIPVGKASLTIHVSDQAGKPVIGAQVRALVQMPSMGMGEKETTAVPEPGRPGEYSTDVAFGMAGTYGAKLTIQGPKGKASGTVELKTGQNTAGGASTVNPLPWLIALVMVGFVIYRMKRTGQRVNWRAITTRGTLTGVALLSGMLAVSAYAVQHWRRAGAMTPIQAQAMQMETPAPPGAAPVTLAAVTRGPVQSTVRYTGQAVGFDEEDVNVRTQGWLIRMPFYVGDHVRSGQLLAQLDTSQQNPLVAQQKAAVNVASSGVDVAQRDYQQALAAVNQAKAEVQGKRDAQAAAEADTRTARESEAAAEADLQAVRTQLVSARAAVEAANQDLAAAQQQVVNQTAELNSTSADQQYWQQEIAREKSLLDRGAVSPEEYQRELSQASTADARVQQAEAGIAQTRAQARAAQARVQETQAAVNQARAQILSAEAQVRKAGSAVTYTVRKADQSGADVQSNEAAVQSAQAAAEAARQRISQGEAGVQQAQAMLAGATTSRDYSTVLSPLDGVITQRLISPGTLVNPGEAIYRVAQINPIRLQANVSQEDLNRVKV
ncbi:MAG TPA: FixH family protein, partial [Armatimonadota bacterium]|nr:FixH family protein [Armatimonadota bacterium]